MLAPIGWRERGVRSWHGACGGKLVISMYPFQMNNTAP